MSVLSIDDCYLQGDSFTKCVKNVIGTIEILESLGFYIKREKSEIVPKQQITFWGIITKKRDKKNFKLCTAARLAPTLNIRELAKFTRNLVASMEAVLYGRLFYRQLERDKITPLQQSKGNFKAKITLSDLSKK